MLFDDNNGGDKLIIAITLILAFCLMCLFILDCRQDNLGIEERRVIEKQQLKERVHQLEQKRNLEETQKASHAAKQEKDSFYQKLADGFDVNILVVGDSIASGTGASDISNQWVMKLEKQIKEEYGVNVKTKNVSMGGNTSYAGYARTMTIEDDIDFDLAIICYGQNDSTVDFGLYYESIIWAVKERYPKASILCVLESSQREYTEKMEVIKDIAEYYELPIVDTIAPFSDDYDNLSDDGVHPNDAGHQVYCETVMNVIEPLVTSRKGHEISRNIPINEEIAVFDRFKWYPNDRFIRKGNTYLLKLKTKGTILGIDYSFNTGSNSCKIFLDDIEYASPEVSFNYDFSQRHIMVVNDWKSGEMVDVQNEIRIEFTEDESGTKQADEFNGLIISG